MDSQNPLNRFQIQNNFSSYEQVDPVSAIELEDFNETGSST